jgi:hypothetical protein
MYPIIPIKRKDPFDDPAWIFELKLDGFRGIADIIKSSMILDPLALRRAARGLYSRRRVGTGSMWAPITPW